MSSLTNQSDSLSYDLLLQKSYAGGRVQGLQGSSDDASTAPSTAKSGWHSCTSRGEDGVSCTSHDDAEEDVPLASREEETSEALPAKEPGRMALGYKPKVVMKNAFAALDDDDDVEVPAKAGVKLLRNVSIIDAKISNLIMEARDLSNQAFDEDCLEEVTKKSGWKLSLLVSSDLATLCGFIVAKVTKGALSIAKIAVRSEFRRHGFGRLIMEEMIKSAKQQSDVYEVCLSSLAEAVKFYQRLGFKAFKNLKVDASRTDLVAGQIYMEKKLRPRPKK